MSSAVSSLLVRDQVVAVRLVEEALERQVLYGGDLETNLLELRGAHEEVLAEYRARAAGLSVAGRRELALASPSALRLISREHAERWRIVPLRLEGHVLVVAAAEPPPQEAIDELGFLLSVEVSTRIGMEHRLAWALNRYYGLAVAPRMRRILDRIAAEDDEARALEASEPPAVLQTPAILIAPPVTAMPEPAPTLIEHLRIEPVDLPKGEPTERFHRPGPVTFVEFPAVTIPPPVTTREAHATRLGIPAPVPPGPPDPEPTPVPVPAPVPDPEPAIAERPRSQPRITLPPPEPATPIALPATFAERLAVAATRDEVVDTLLAAGHYLFEYVAMFAVHDGSLDGKRSVGPGALTEEVSHLHVVLEGSSAFKTACETRSVFIGPSVSGADTNVLVALRRRPPSICLVPVGMRGRTVLLLYADAGDRPVAARAAAEMAALAPRAAMSLERVILAKKIADRGRRASVAPQAEPPVVMTAPVSVSDPQPVAPAEALPPEGEIPIELSVRKRAPSDPHISRATIPAPPPEFEYEEVSVEAGRADDIDLWDDDGGDDAPEEMDEEVHEDEILEEEADGSLRVEIDRLLQGYVEDPAAAAAQPKRVRRIRSKQQTLPDVGRPAALQQPVSGISGRRGTEPPRPNDPEGPSVIFDVGGNVEKLVETLFAAPEESDLAAAALQKLGEASLPALIRRFPGPLRFDRRTARGPLPRAADCGPLLRLLVAFRKQALPYVRPLFESADSDARFYAVLLEREYQASELVPLLERRLFDDDYGVRMLALDTMRLHRRFAEFDEALRDLRAYAGDDRMPLETRLRSTEALGALHDVASLRTLVGLLESPAADLRQAALRGLVAITCQDFGPAPRKWFAWLDKNASRHRIEWLIDALVHPSADIRLAASEELKRLTKEYFGYYYNLPKRDRERARKRYLEWWARVGKARFGS